MDAGDASRRRGWDGDAQPHRSQGGSGVLRASPLLPGGGEGSVGQMGLRGARAGPGAGEDADGAGWVLSRCHQSAPAPPSAAASPGCKSDLNKAEGFSARSGLAVGIRSGDSVATGRPCVPAGPAKGE